jgi:hypothetical protein
VLLGLRRLRGSLALNRLDPGDLAPQLSQQDRVLQIFVR